MSAQHHINPQFGPASGWYQPGQHAPGSTGDRAAMRAAAVPATVIVLRQRGARIPTSKLLLADPPSGLLLCMDRYTAPQWHVCLFAGTAMDKELLPRLLHAQLERENDGVRLYGGIEPGERGQPDFRQAWLCTPTPGKAREILLAMLAREGGDLDV